MKITRNNSDEIVQSVALVIEPSDYKEKLDVELKKLSKNVQIKGFRKGKVPSSFIKRNYGKSVKHEVILNVLNEKLNNFLQDENMYVLLRPMLKKSPYDLSQNLDSTDNFAFEFQVLVQPELSLNGLSENDTYEMYEVIIEDEMVEKELDLLLRRFGTQGEIEEPIEENDMLVLVGKELGEDGSVSNDGWDTSFSILVDSRMHEDAKEKVIGKSVGDTFVFDIYELQPDLSHHRVRTTLLNMDDDEDIMVGNEFEFVIDEVKRVIPAEVNDELWEKAFGEKTDVKDMATARERIVTLLSLPYSPYINGFLFEKIQERLLNENTIYIDRDFLSSYLEDQAQAEKVKYNFSEVDVDDLEKHLKWRIILNALKKKYDIEVSEQEIRNHFKRNVLETIFQSNLQHLIESDGGKFIENFVDMQISDEKEKNKVYDSIFHGKVVEGVKKDIVLDIKKVTKEELNDIIEIGYNTNGEDEEE